MSKIEKLTIETEKTLKIHGFSNKKDTINFDILDLSNWESTSIFSFEYSRRQYYTVTLLRGEYTLEFEDKKIDIAGNTLTLTSSKIPFGITSKSNIHKGISCLFAETFVTRVNSGYRILEFPAYRPGNQNIYSLTNEQAELFTSIFSKIQDEKEIDSLFKEDLLRIYLLELIFNAQKLVPSNSFTRTNNSNTSEEIACSFIRLLESQFPIQTTKDSMKLKTVKEFANQLSLHPTYLNRQVKISKGKTVSDIISARILQESKILLKVTNWNISEIAWSLGFEEPSHFNSFFKRYLKTSPTDFRKTKM